MSLSRHVVHALIALSAASPCLHGQALPVVQQEPERMATLLLGDGSRYETTLFDVKVLGVLPARSKAAFIVLSGFGCNDCDASRSIYIDSPSDGAMKYESTHERYAFPGKVTDWETESTLTSSRMFIGTCVDDVPRVTWFQGERTRSGQWRESIYMVSVSPADTLISQTLPARAHSIDAVLRRTQASSGCIEVPGEDRGREP